MAASSPSFHSPNNDNYNDRENDDAAGHYLRPGGSRQARKLQLRNAGFRGGTVPTRILTPKSIPSSTWSAAGDSGTENVPPSTTDVRTPSNGRRVSSGILQDIGNSTITRRKRATSRLVSSRWSGSEGSGGEERHALRSISQSQGKGTIRQRTVKTKPKVNHKRRSVSAETSKYIEHLEAELAASQSQLSRINSPTVTRQQTTKMRHIDAETRLLQKEIEDWEAKYEQRVQEEVDSHAEIETVLRGRVRTLEQEVDETRFQMQELEARLHLATQNMEAVETANVNMERRIEIMSDLLAASPSKIDLHAETPGRARRNSRPKSMLPRFPTASSLMGSPERQSHTQPPSPLLTFTNYSPNLIASPVQSVCRLDISSQQSDYMSEAESVFSEVSANGDSMTSAENLESQPNFNPWNLPPPLPNRARPARRMRRFGAGSFGPKPLILPSTFHGDHFPPASVSVLERSETTPAFFPDRTLSSHDSHSPLLGRRRASTIAHGEILAVLDPSPFSNEQLEECGEETLMSFNASSSPSSRPVPRDLSSFGSAKGKNLMEELTTAWTSDSALSSEIVVASDEIPGNLEVASDGADASSRLGDGTTLVQGTFTYPQAFNPVERRAASSSTAIAQPQHHRACSQSISIPATHSASVLERLRFLFGDLWRSPLDLARHLVRTAQACMRIPRTLLNIQWWLVGALIGPLARRRAFHELTHSHDNESEHSYSEDSLSKDIEAGNMAYGTLDETPPHSPSRKASIRKKRAAHKVRCPHRRAKHSPLLWVKFSLTIALALGAAVKDGPGSLLETTV